MLCCAASQPASQTLGQQLHHTTGLAEYFRVKICSCCLNDVSDADEPSLPLYEINKGGDGRVCLNEEVQASDDGWAPNVAVGPGPRWVINYWLGSQALIGRARHCRAFLFCFLLQGSLATALGGTNRATWASWGRTLARWVLRGALQRIYSGPT